MNRKKIMAGLLLCLLIFSFTGCKSDPSAVTSSETTEDGNLLFTRTIVIDDLYSKDDLQAEETITALTHIGDFSEEELTYSLTDISWNNVMIGNQTITLASSIDYGFSSTKPEPPANKSVSYIDPISKKAITATLPLVYFDVKGGYTGDATFVDTEVAENASVNELVDEKFKDGDSAQKTYGWAWRSDLIIPCKATLTGEYLAFGSVYIPYNEDKPTFATYEKAILQSLKLSSDKYRITNSFWSSDVRIENGVEVRYGNFTGERYSANYIAVYADTVQLPDRAGYQAVLTYTTTHSPTIGISGVVLFGLGGLLLAGGVIAALLVMSRKNKKKKYKL